MRPKTLLVVDDEPANVELIRMIVEDAALPVQFVTARNGEEALARAREAPPDLMQHAAGVPSGASTTVTRSGRSRACA